MISFCVVVSNQSGDNKEVFPPEAWLGLRNRISDALVACGCSGDCFLRGDGQAASWLARRLGDEPRLRAKLQEIANTSGRNVFLSEFTPEVLSPAPQDQSTG